MTIESAANMRMLEMGITKGKKEAARLNKKIDSGTVKKTELTGSSKNEERMSKITDSFLGGDN